MVSAYDSRLDGRAQSRPRCPGRKTVIPSSVITGRLDLWSPGTSNHASALSKSRCAI